MMQKNAGRLTGFIFFAIVLGLVVGFTLLPATSRADDCSMAVIEYSAALEHVMELNRSFLKELTIRAKKMKKSAKTYKALWEDANAAAKDKNISQKEKNKIFKMAKKVNSLNQQLSILSTDWSTMKNAINEVKMMEKIMDKKCN